MPEAKHVSELPDIQNMTEGFPRKYINKVGINKVMLPVRVQRKDGTYNESTAKISVYSDLNQETKGVNMSRYRILLEDVFIHKNLNLKDAVRDTMREVRELLKAENAYLKVSFDYFLEKKAPVTKLTSLQNYKCSLEGRLINGVDKYYLKVVTPYTSLCPCSKEISAYNAHNQRSFGEVTVELMEDADLCWIEDIVDLIESTGAAPIINVLKRPDEKWQTELMYENPVFVEDMARKVSEKLDEWLDNKILDYVFVTNHEESIHTHDACAVISAGRQLA
jgi:GTP cyclohydrolase I